MPRPKMFESYWKLICGKKILLTYKKVKRLRMTIDPKSLEIKISVPEYTSMQSIVSFVEKNLNWIEKNQERLLMRRGKMTELKNAKHIVIFGIELPLKLELSKRFSSVFYEDEVILKVRNFSDEEIFRCIHAFYKKELIRFIDEILLDCENRLGEKVASINYRTMKTKLGSCKPEEKKISLNTRLAQYREECIEMVLIHEIVHFKEFYHNARFKALMTKYCSNWKELRKEMKNCSSVRF